MKLPTTVECDMQFENQGGHLNVSYDDGFRHTYHAFWLRESSDEPSYRDKRTGHKIQDADAIPLDVQIVNVQGEGDIADISFSDGHRSIYSLAKLKAAAQQPMTSELIGEKQPWNSALDPLPWHKLSVLKKNPQALLDLLNDLATLGFAVVRGVPEVNQGSREFLDLLGHTRITNNGDIEDIKALPTGKTYDLSMTPRALEPHVDNPYRLPQPGYTTLHCIQNDAVGGDSALVDGLYVAKTIRRDRPDLFEALTTVPVVFRYIDDQAILETSLPFISLGPDGSIQHIRYHGRCDQVIATDPETLTTFYEARRLYSSLINDRQTQVRFKLNPGEMFIVDNYRLFHARTAFNLETGARHMQQAYIDRDVVSSRQKTLLRNLDAKPWKSRI
jgi:gamma-butyrobetaine dioxygenase